MTLWDLGRPIDVCLTHNGVTAECRPGKERSCSQDKESGSFYDRNRTFYFWLFIEGNWELYPQVGGGGAHRALDGER